MFISRPVRRMCEEPVAGQAVTLLVEAAEEAETVRRRLAALDGVTVVADRQLDTIEVRTDQERVAAVCEVAGVAAVETDAALATTLDGAGEDVEY